MKKGQELSKKRRKQIINYFDASKVLMDMQTKRTIRLREIVEEVLNYVEGKEQDQKDKLVFNLISIEM